MLSVHAADCVDLIGCYCAGYVQQQETQPTAPLPPGSCEGCNTLQGGRSRTSSTILAATLQIISIWCSLVWTCEQPR
jgi:hypothetical protein